MLASISYKDKNKRLIRLTKIEIGPQIAALSFCADVKQKTYSSVCFPFFQQCKNTHHTTSENEQAVGTEQLLQNSVSCHQRRTQLLMFNLNYLLLRHDRATRVLGVWFQTMLRQVLRQKYHRLTQQCDRGVDTSTK